MEGSQSGSDRGQRAWGVLVSVVLLAAVFYPLRFESGRDSFPLSTYPMFGASRPNAHLEMHYAFGLGKNGERMWIPPKLVANAEVLQARAVIRDAVAAGPFASDALCRHIAGRVAEVGGEFAAIAEVRIVLGEHDAVGYLARGEQGTETVVSRCEVRR